MTWEAFGVLVLTTLLVGLPFVTLLGLVWYRVRKARRVSSRHQV